MLKVRVGHVLYSPHVPLALREACRIARGLGCPKTENVRRASPHQCHKPFLSCTCADPAEGRGRRSFGRGIGR